MLETADDWEQEIGVLIDPDAFAEVWVGLVNEKDEMDDVFAKFLISHREEDREFHVIWKNSTLLTHINLQTKTGLILN